MKTVCVISEVSGMVAVRYDMAGYRFLAMWCSCQIMLQHVMTGFASQAVIQGKHAWPHMNHLQPFFPQHVM